MKEVKTYRIKGAAYPIIVGKNLSSTFRSFFRKNNYSSYFVLVDEYTEKCCLPTFTKKCGINPTVIKIRSGEKHKSIESCVQIWERLTHLKADRNSLLINLGGGVIGDMGGFAAACYKRGIDFIQVPTTLLSMVDASVGGKTGIDLGGLKNQIGLFTQPKAVFADTDFLKTLPEREMKSGYAEIIKHVLIADKKLYSELKSANGVKVDAKLIAKNIEIKKRIVLKDPKEKGLRKVLNFGHTFGHALESLSFEKGQNQLLHGEAVIAGMMMETYLSFQKKLLAKKTFIEVYTFLKQLNVARSIEKKQENKLYELMLNDKKNRKSDILFTLLCDIGKPLYDEVATKNEIVDVIRFYNLSLDKNDLQSIL